MSKPKGSVISKTVTKMSSSTPINTDLEIKLNSHINDKSIHLEEDIRDNISFLRKDVDNHLNDQVIHITDKERQAWNGKETPNGAQAKVNKVVASLDNHKVDYSIHTTKAEKDLFKDKYTKAETRNLLKHALTGLVFLPSVINRTELDKKYHTPKFNSCVYLRNDKITLIYNGQEWVEFNALFTPEITKEFDGLMTNDDKIKLDSIEQGANNYIHPDNVDVRHVSDSQISIWNNKADNVLVNYTTDGLMDKDDKLKLDSIEEGANRYIHPENHLPSIILEDKDHRFVTDIEKELWNNKAEVKYVNESVDKVLKASKSFTDAKVAAIFNSSEDQLQVLRSLAFELKNDTTVKQFFDLYNECAKNIELQDHTLNSKIHMSNADRILLKNVNEALSSGLNPDWNETNASSLKYIENKPTSLPANGGNADTVGGYTAEELLNDTCLYDHIIADNNEIDYIINRINKGLGHNVIVKPGSFTKDEIVIKASNTKFTGIGTISKFLDTSIKIIGNNNTIENISFTNGTDGIVNKTAIYVEGNDNIIRNCTVMNYNNAIIVEGSNNTIQNNTCVNIRNNAIKFTADINSNYGNIIEENTIKNSNIGITLLSSNNTLTKNHVCKNKVLTCSVGIVLSNTLNNITKTTMNIINENIVVRGRGDSSEYLPTHKTIISEFSSKNIISSNITSGKSIVAPNDVLSNNIF